MPRIRPTGERPVLMPHRAEQRGAELSVQRTLGGVSLSSDSCVLGGAASQRRRLALLSLIAASGDRGVTRDRLIGLLWPDSEPAKARQVLTQWLHLIRHDLGDGALFQGTATLRLNLSHITSDVGELHDAMDSNEAERAAALYAGPFLDGFYLNGAPEFERWAEEERGRLAARMRSTYEALTRRAMTIEAWPAAVHWSERLVGLDPVDAGAAIAYMRALASAGERARAIRHAGVHAHTMRDQMETEPDEAVESLAAQLRSRPRTVPRSRRE